MNFSSKSRQDLISLIESKYLKLDLPKVSVGDTVRIGILIQEGNKQRTQFSEGVVICKKNFGINTTITVRRVMQGIGVEKVYLLNSPRIKQLSVMRSSRVRRAKLYYLRKLSGKATRLKQKFS
uniref:ribosomal protein L19 n=1 Tax=Madagascaria erythrocladioides TaxID=753684 RepID=UPI001BF0FFE3|nr:ribosomal protein L19 [Madagascaria erythrocladioides]QUE29005.1 ribosomal protein L19 [Madagascaria erythrocladioides]UNJ16557.1 ribosomal protein L19 [Madagascaria erythrocladioides]